MRHEDLRVLLEDGGHRDDGHAARDVVERAEQAPAHVEVEAARGQELGAVDLRPTLPDRHVEAVAAVDARGHCLVEAAMLGLRAPVGAEDDTVELLRAGNAGEYRDCRGAGEERSPGHVETVRARPDPCHGAFMVPQNRGLALKPTLGSHAGGGQSYVPEWMPSPTFLRMSSSGPGG